MATSRLCSQCKKEPGPMHCTGCNKYLCWKDFKTHREQMFTELDKIVEERNQLQETIHVGAASSDQKSPLLEQIDQWKRNTIAKVEEVAAQVRQQTIELLNRKQTKVNDEFRSFSQDLIKLRESENYVEHDLERLKKKIQQFKQDIKQSTRPINILLHTDQSDKIQWESLIYIEEKQMSVNDPRQPLNTGKKMIVTCETSIPLEYFLSNKHFSRQHI